jgi:WD40 repeat protein
MKSHFEGEVWGLDVDDKAGRLITSGDDNQIMVWDINERNCQSTGIISDKKEKKERIAKRRKAGGGASTLSSKNEIQCARAIAFN